MPRKTNNYITADRAKLLADESTYFQRVFPNKGGFFLVNDATLKVNEKTFKTIQPFLKPRN
jgi:hypothetical protein